MVNMKYFFASKCRYVAEAYDLKLKQKQTTPGFKLSRLDRKQIVKDSLASHNRSRNLIGQGRKLASMQMYRTENSEEHVEKESPSKLTSYPSGKRIKVMSTTAHAGNQCKTVPVLCCKNVSIKPEK